VFFCAGSLSARRRACGSEGGSQGSPAVGCPGGCPARAVRDGVIIEEEDPCASGRLSLIISVDGALFDADSGAEAAGVGDAAELRPCCREFLDLVAPLFEVHAFSRGSASAAVARALRPVSAVFADRVACGEHAVFPFADRTTVVLTAGRDALQFSAVVGIEPFSRAAPGPDAPLLRAGAVPLT